MNKITAPVITKPLSKGYAVEGGSNQLAVEFTSRPEPEVHWYVNGTPVRADSRHNINTVGDCSKLDIRNIDLDDEGVYTVKIINDAGSASCQAELLVECK